MCAQCAATGAVTVTAAATGARVWIVAMAPVWLTAARKRVLSGVVIVAAVTATALVA